VSKITIGQAVGGPLDIVATPLYVDLPTLVETRLLVQANSGAGKSWTLRRLLEQSFGMVQHLVIDPEGEFASLREKHDYILAGRDGDTVAEPRVAKLLARRLLEEQASAIIDIYELRAHERVRFVRLFLEALVEAPKSLWHPALVVIDEAHVYAPQRGEAESLGPVIDLATRGRKRGFCAVLATQRIAKLHKDAAAELNNKLIGRSSLDVDMKRAAEELGFTSREDQASLRSLRPGQFYAFGPAMADDVTLVDIGAVETTHPKVGARLLAPPPPSEKLKAVLSKLADLPEAAEQEAKDVAGLQGKVRDLERKLAQIGKSGIDGAGASEAEVRRAVAAAVRERDAQIKALQADATRISAVHGRLLTTLRNQGNAVLGAAERLVDELDQYVPSPRSANSADNMREKLQGRPGTPSARFTFPPALPDEDRRDFPTDSLPSIDGLKAGAVRILRELASRHPATWTKSQVGALTGFTPSGGTFGTYIGELRRRGLIEISGNEVRASEEGLAQCGEIPPAPASHDEVMAMWRRALKAGAYRMLELTAECGAQGIDREELADLSGFTSSGGTYGTYLGTLRRNGLIRVEGTQVIAEDVLWP